MVSLSIAFVDILIVYFLWYVQAIGNNMLILYGCTIGATACMVLDVFLKKEISLNRIPLGIMMNLFMVFYSIIAGAILRNEPSLILKSVTTYFAFSMVMVNIAWIAYNKGQV